MQEGCPPGTIGFDPATLEFTAEEGDTAIMTLGQFHVINIGPPGSVLGNFSVKSLAGWVKPIPSGNLVYVRVNPSGKLAGEYPFQIEVSDPIATNSPQYFPGKLTVISQPEPPPPPPPPPLRIMTESLPDGVEGVYYEAEVQVMGGTPPYFIKCTGLPPDFSFDLANRSISGLPSTYGEFVVVVKVIDDADDSVEKSYMINIEPMPEPLPPEPSWWQKVIEWLKKLFTLIWPG